MRFIDDTDMFAGAETQQSRVGSERCIRSCVRIIACFIKHNFMSRCHTVQENWLFIIDLWSMLDKLIVCVVVIVTIETKLWMIGNMCSC